MATVLANSRWVSKRLYDRAVEALGHVGITDVITLMGYYTTLAFYDACRPRRAGIARWPAAADMNLAASCDLLRRGGLVLAVLEDDGRSSRGFSRRRSSNDD
jgi:hypothetical protein